MFGLTVMVHAYNPNIQKVEEGGPQVLGQPELNSETLLKSKTWSGVMVQWLRALVTKSEPECHPQNPRVRGRDGSLQAFLQPPHA